jgi:hypothetical protein
MMKQALQRFLFETPDLSTLEKTKALTNPCAWTTNTPYWCWRHFFLAPCLPRVSRMEVCLKLDLWTMFSHMRTVGSTTNMEIPFWRFWVWVTVMGWLAKIWSPSSPPLEICWNWSSPLFSYLRVLKVNMQSIFRFEDNSYELRCQGWLATCRVV